MASSLPKDFGQGGAGTSGFTSPSLKEILADIINTLNDTNATLATLVAAFNVHNHDVANVGFSSKPRNASVDGPTLGNTNGTLYQATEPSASSVSIQ